MPLLKSVSHLIYLTLHMLNFFSLPKLEITLNKEYCRALRASRKT